MDLNKLFRPKKLAIIGGYWADFVALKEKFGTLILKEVLPKKRNIIKV